MPTNDELINKGKQLFQANWISIGIVFIAILIVLVIGFTIGRYNPDPNSQVVKNMINQKLIEERKAFDQSMKEKDDVIASIQDKLNKSNKTYSSYVKSIKDINEQIRNVKEPKNSKETKTRLKELGYETK